MPSSLEGEIKNNATQQQNPNFHSLGSRNLLHCSKQLKEEIPMGNHRLSTVKLFAIAIGFTKMRA